MEGGEVGEGAGVSVDASGDWVVIAVVAGNGVSNGGSVGESVHASNPKQPNPAMIKTNIRLTIREIKLDNKIFLQSGLARDKVSRHAPLFY